ncbi:sugar phosphate isomerase/epimerase [Mycobacterium crocinum]|uniref:Sugar phosphate isomerase/epimerase n=1 Tax=Mycolicibacterium crocinum TaxID=388459 RepID=A0ABY3TH22_9MYCO|nr:sugar phosphate isomerase/epimerase [Mycolicibacterium crocinum]MCV7217002.1 sugar phosphate isomerase/epimerase [Mycolicibacterium crocinum]ULN40254.1 sugar phosphate isomerase/epimerase [Mycolicibacterium crocinum]
MHEQLSVHDVTFLGSSPAEVQRNWAELGLRCLSVLDTELLDPDFRRVIEGSDQIVQAVCHVFGSGRVPTDERSVGAARDALLRVIDVAASVDARCIYMLTGGRGELSWEQAADAFGAAIQPCLHEAEQVGVSLAIENASALYADIHMAHSLRDTITLAESAGLDICIDLFHCWAEADLTGLLRKALPRTRLIQLSDYVLGDRGLPARAVPGDGAIPIESFVAQALSDGYRFGFDLELLGPRIDAEGRLAAAQRACDVVRGMLDRLGGCDEEESSGVQ